MKYEIAMKYVIKINAITIYVPQHLMLPPNFHVTTFPGKRKKKEEISQFLEFLQSSQHRFTLD